MSRISLEFPRSIAELPSLRARSGSTARLAWDQARRPYLGLFATVWLLLAFLDSPLAAQIDTALIRQIGATNEANFRKLETWTAIYDREDDLGRSMNFAGPGQPDDVKRVRVIQPTTWTFSLDNIQGKVFWALERGSNTTIYTEGGEQKVASPYGGLPLFGSTRTLFDGHAVYTASPDLLRGAVPGFPNDPYAADGQSRVVDRQIVSSAIVTRRMYWHPDRLFQMMPNNHPWDLVSGMADYLDGKHGSEQAELLSNTTSLVCDQSRIVVVWKTIPTPVDKTSIASSEVQFDASSLLPLESTLTCGNGNIWNHTSFEWKKDRGVYVPKNYVFVKYDRDGKKQESTSAVLRESVVNGKLPADAFSLDRLGITDGDRLRDLTTNELFVFKNGIPEPIPTAASFDQTQSPSTEPTEPTEPAPRRTRFWVLAAATMLCIAVLLVLRRLRS